jgi:L-alanine-DL-glutamate epimerase-like enolase superfamily enzyme
VKALIDRSAPLRLSAAIETWPIAGTFTISRGTKREAVVVVAEVSDGRHVGRGECTPYPRYGETPEATLAAIESLGAAIRVDRAALQRLMPPGAARNALDCALWDLEAKMASERAWQRACLAAPSPVLTCFTISLASPAAMAAQAASVPHLPLLKLKLGAKDDADGDIARMREVRRARPDARLVADANEGWAVADVERLLAAAVEFGLETVEQPLPAGADGMLADIPHPLPVCADESAHTADGVAALRPRYDALNIKLDKTGGFTQALETAAAARAAGLRTMVGCMVATSLAMAPALLLAQGADWVDLDGPLLLDRDRSPGLVIENGMIAPAEPALWG